MNTSINVNIFGQPIEDSEFGRPIFSRTKNMNLVSLSGRIGKTPELQTSQSGESWTLFNLAVNTGPDETVWFPCKALHKVAELLCETMKSGFGLDVFGHFRQDGEDYIVHVDRFSKAGGGTDGN